MKSVAFILKGYPRLSETFIAQEIRALELRGLEVNIVSLRHPTDTTAHPIHSEIEASINYLPEYLCDEPIRVLKALSNICRRTPFWIALRVWFRDLRRDATLNRMRRFGQAAVMATELAPRVTHLYAHFLHTPASVTRYASIMTGLPWSVSAHAKDIWTIPDWEKRDKLADCDWAVTCTATGYQHLTSLAPANRVHLVYHGLDLDRFPPSENGFPLHDGSDSQEPVTRMGPKSSISWPIVLITNPGTAGAAELFAAVLTDTTTAESVGTRTAGRAAEQTLVNLPDGGGLLLSSSHYLTASGTSIHRTGIEPTVAVQEPTIELTQTPVVPMEDPLLDRALERVLQMTTQL